MNNKHNSLYSLSYWKALSIPITINMKFKLVKKVLLRASNIFMKKLHKSYKKLINNASNLIELELIRVQMLVTVNNAVATKYNY